MTSPVRAVFDTNVAVSALLFRAGRLAWLREAWRDGGIVPVVSRDTVGELVRVLAYPKFRLTTAEQEELLGDYLPFAETIRPACRHARASVCRDPHDRIFLELALVAAADALVTGDKDLLTLERVGACPILTPEAFRAVTDG